eukprot:scaffold35324_cov58-Phaeocystis_antarctica.AAC.3
MNATGHPMALQWLRWGAAVDGRDALVPLDELCLCYGTVGRRPAAADRACSAQLFGEQTPG